HYVGRVEDGWYIAEGVASHAMTPQKGLNAGFILFDFLNECFSTKLSRFFVKYFTFDPFGKKLGIDIYDPLMKELTCNVGIIKIQNDRIFIGVDCRVPVRNYEEKLSRVVQTAGMDAQLEGKLVSFDGYHYVDPKSKLVTVLMDAYKEVTKDMQAKPMTIGGGTYAKFIENGVAFGPLLPGREDVCHIANEYMYMSDFLQAITIYAKAIYELTKDVCD
ncbi:MAG: M20/M25/M40 family metallo-hydrolase, partial [Anaeroplasmataceae bacterium]|nr:M20/M25/M40 family metallo-hydrolase [Anaeroplasmataceae bacterium]